MGIINGKYSEAEETLICYLQRHRWIESRKRSHQYTIDKYTHFLSFHVSSAIDEKLQSFIDRIQQDIAQLEADRARIEAAIDAVTDDTYRQLLSCRYLQGMTWEQIAERINYCLTYTMRLHKRALGQVVTL